MTQDDVEVAPNATGTPHLRRTAAGAQLVVDGSPRLLLAGQAHNSSPSGEQYVTEVCGHVAKMNVQTLLVGISWSSTEPVEGTDDFTILDTLLTQARAHRLRLVLLWFGSFKNAASTYAPTWVRADTARFPRAVQHSTARALFTYADEMPKPVLSVFSPALRQVEQRAFAAMLQHLEREDRDHTVVMVQVENESGILRDSRDRSAAAQQAWEAEVPAALSGKSAMADYARDDNPLFIPEAQFRTGSLFYALGHHRALGFSVFGVEDGRVESQLATAYALLTAMQDVIAAAQADNRIQGILLDEETRANLSLGGYDITAQGSRDLIGSMLLDAGVPVPPPPPAPSEVAGAGIPPQPADQRPFGLIISEGPDQFLLVGQGLTVNFRHPDGRVELDHAEEGRFMNGTWQPGRALNGDERLYLVPPDELGAVRIRLLRTDIG